MDWSQLRGKRSDRALSEAYRELVVARVRERHTDFGPTLAREKLADFHGISVAVETLRAWLIAAGV